MFFLGLTVGIIIVIVIGIALVYDTFMNNKLLQTFLNSNQNKRKQKLNVCP